VTEYGADPSGNEESSDAILKAVEDAFGLQKGYEMDARVDELGGVVIDLEGGNYKISKPITFPSGTGNVVVSIYLSIYFLLLCYLCLKSMLFVVQVVCFFVCLIGMIVCFFLPWKILLSVHMFRCCSIWSNYTFKYTFSFDHNSFN